MSRFINTYKSIIQPQLKSELALGNDLSVPKIEKVVINAGVGKIITQQPKALEQVIEVVRKITGQQPVVRKAKKAIAGFKIRQGQPVGVSVTLRGKRMYEFLDKLINAALPRTRDFRGIPKSGFDSQGNYSLGLREYIIFPEMAQEEHTINFGLQVTVSTSAHSPERGYLLLKKFGFPFKD